MKRLGLVVCVLCVGCQRGVAPSPPVVRADPASATLATGSEALVYDADLNTIPVFVPYERPGKGDSETIENVKVGTRVVIVDDEHRLTNHGESYTRISVNESHYKGPARIPRQYLRPVPR